MLPAIVQEQTTAKGRHPGDRIPALEGVNKAYLPLRAIDDGHPFDVR